MALAQLFLYQSVERFQFIDDGQLVVVPEKSTTKSYVLEFLGHQQIPQSSLRDIPSFSWKDSMRDVSLIFWNVIHHEV